MSGRKHAILVGTGRYDEPLLSDLRCPARDVDGIRRVLQSESHGGFTSVVPLKDRRHDEVRKSINQVLKKAEKEDLVVIYFSGHGKLDLANRLYLCTTDTTLDALEATSVPIRDIKDYADLSACNQIALILDCCFSGAAGGAFAKSGIDDQLQLVAGGRGTYIMTASTGIQVAMEKEADENSVFTKHIVQGIEAGDADLDEDGLITMDELYRYVHAKVQEDGFQEPMKWSIDVRGEMVVSRTRKSRRTQRRLLVRERLLQLANERVLPDPVFAKAITVISTPAGELHGVAREHDRLIDRLVQDELSVGDFVEAWYSIELRHRAVAPPVRVPPEPADDDAPVPEDDVAPGARLDPPSGGAPAPRDAERAANFAWKRSLGRLAVSLVGIVAGLLAVLWLAKSTKWLVLVLVALPLAWAGLAAAMRGRFDAWQWTRWPPVIWGLCGGIAGIGLGFAVWLLFAGKNGAAMFVLLAAASLATLCEGLAFRRVVRRRRFVAACSAGWLGGAIVGAVLGGTQVDNAGEMFIIAGIYGLFGWLIGSAWAAGRYSRPTPYRHPETASPIS